MIDSLIAVLTLCALMILTGCNEPAEEKISLDFPNKSFYDADGKFNEDAGHLAQYSPAAPHRSIFPAFQYLDYLREFPDPQIADISA